jgi:tRNA/tmRNA/rRNA uracil-C5-methylase (TrmA/RlmC/RlmD family)
VSVQQTLPAGCEPDCRGCRHRTLPLVASVAQKQGYLQRVLDRWGRVLQPVRSVQEERRFGYRDRVTLNARWDAAVGWQFGMMRREELIPIPACPVHSARVNRLVALLRATLPVHANFPLAYLHVAGGQATLIVKARNYEAACLDVLRAGLATTGVEGLWVHCHASAGRKLFARSGWHLAWGASTSLDAAGLVHGPAAFQQLLPDLHAQAVALARDHLDPAPGVAVLDLYCGIGSTLRQWVLAGASAFGVELAGGAVDCARINAPGAVALRGTCEQRLPQAREWWHDGNHSRHVCYVNPPRSGLEPGLLDALARDLRPDRIAYLSCSAGTLARDLAVFETAGYIVSSIAPFDFFPGTHHVECLALLTLVRSLDAGEPAFDDGRLS